VPSHWQLAWHDDCSSFGQQGLFQVYVYAPGGNLAITNAPVNQLGSGGSGVEHYHSGGSTYLVVNSVCSWGVTVNPE
jgi:hypothetical protein